MIAFNRGENIPLKLYLYDDDGVLFDPTSLPTVSITDPDNISYLATSDMTFNSGGIYFYNKSSSATDKLGKYIVEYIILDQGLTTIQYDTFELKH